MINLRVKIKTGDCLDLQNSIFCALSENIMELHYVDFYNITHLIKRLKDRSYNSTMFDPFKSSGKPSVFRININEANSYRVLMMMESVIWEDIYLATLHRELVEQIDRQTMEIKKFN